MRTLRTELVFWVLALGLLTAVCAYCGEPTEPERPRVVLVYPGDDEQLVLALQIARDALLVIQYEEEAAEARMRAGDALYQIREVLDG